MKDKCTLTPGDRFATRALADDAIVTRKLNIVANGGAAVAADEYEVKGCRCDGFHVMTRTQMERRRRRRRRQG